MIALVAALLLSAEPAAAARCALVESAEGAICYVRCSGAQTLNGSLNVTGTLSAAFADAGVIMSAGPVTQRGTGIGFVSHAASGTDGFRFATNGARGHFGTGADTFFIDNGSNQLTTNARIIVGGSSSIDQQFIGTGGYLQAQGANARLYLGSNPGIFGNAPTISSGFGTSPSVTANNGSWGFTVNVGTGGTASSGVIALNGTAITGWRCICDDLTTQSATVFITKQTASSTTTCTVTNFNTAGAAAAWVASNILLCHAIAY